MQSKTKRTTRKTVAVATTDGVPSKPTDTRSASRTPESQAASSGVAAGDPRDLQLGVLASCAAVLLTSRTGKLEDAFAILAPPLELDAYACFVANEGDHSFALESAHGLSDVALSGSAIAAIVTELTLAGQRTLVLESLRRNTDARSATLRDLGFASAVIGALVVDDHVLGAVVFGSRSKEHFTAGEVALIDTVVCYLTAALERRELAQHRHNAEQRKREFLTVLAHELRNPLAPLRNALEIMRSNDRARSHVERSAYAMIERQLQQIGRLADDLLDANQVVLGHIELEKQRVLLDAVIERASIQSRPWIESARHTLVVDLPRDAIALDADPKRLARVFSNLVNTAARRMDRGGRIVISAERRDGAVAVFIRARGRTVSGESLNGIFANAAGHGEIADGQTQGGFTAGMTLVKHLVEMHGGTVSAHTDGEGVAVFEVRLPVVPAALLQPHKVAQPSPSADAAAQRDDAAAHSHCGRQRGFCGEHGHAAAAHGQRRPYRERRFGSRRASGGLPARHRAPRHRYAAPRRLRSGTPHSQPDLGP